MEKIKKSCPPKKRGSGLIFAVVLLFVILAMVVTLSSVTVLETKMSQKTKSSVGAFYNSESGVEWALNQIAGKSGTDPISSIGTVDADGKSVKCPTNFGTDVCKVLFLDQYGKVLATTAAINQVKAVRSIGSQDIGSSADTQRAIEAAVAAAAGLYQNSCSMSGTSGWCIRIKTDDGSTECKSTSNLSSPSWNSCTGPFGAASQTGSAGLYQISCAMTGSDAWCVRTKTDNGSTECKSTSNLSSPSWNSCTGPY